MQRTNFSMFNSGERVRAEPRCRLRRARLQHRAVGRTSGAGLPVSDNIDTNFVPQPQPSYTTRSNADGLSGLLEPYLTDPARPHSSG